MKGGKRNGGEDPEKRNSGAEHYARWGKKQKRTYLGGETTTKTIGDAREKRQISSCKKEHPEGEGEMSKNESTREVIEKRTGKENISGGKSRAKVLKKRGGGGKKGGRLRGEAEKKTSQKHAKLTYLQGEGEKGGEVRSQKAGDEKRWGANGVTTGEMNARGSGRRRRVTRKAANPVTAKVTNRRSDRG